MSSSFWIEHLVHNQAMRSMNNAFEIEIIFSIQLNISIYFITYLT